METAPCEEASCSLTTSPAFPVFHVADSENTLFKAQEFKCFIIPASRNTLIKHRNMRGEMIKWSQAGQLLTPFSAAGPMEGRPTET